MVNQLKNMYKDFYIKQIAPREGSNSPFVGTLQGLRFTGRTRSELTDKIDRNSYLVMDMANQKLLSKASIDDDYLEYLLDNAETHAVIAGVTHGKLDTQIGAY